MNFNEGDLVIYKSNYVFWSGLIIKSLDIDIFSLKEKKDLLIMWENGKIEWVESESFKMFSHDWLTHIKL